MSAARSENLPASAGRASNTAMEGRLRTQDSMRKRSKGLEFSTENLSRKKKGSKNREKARIKLAKAYERLVNQRNDYLHKLSRFYINNYDVICVEKLNIKGMVRNHNLDQKILDASWGKFLQLLEYKAESAGVRVVKVPPKGRDWISACRIKMKGWGSPDSPAEMEPLLAYVPASSIIEAGNPQASAVGSSRSN